MVKCSIDGCLKLSARRGWCLAHYGRWRRHGNPLAGGPPPGLAKQFITAVIENSSTIDPDACLLWPFARNPQGYAVFTVEGQLWLAARFVCLKVHGKPPSTQRYEAAHYCGRGYDSCINPHHIRWATSAENKADMIKHGTIMRGEKNSANKLSRDDILEIRRSLRSGEEQAPIAARYGIAQSHVSRIKHGKTWDWLFEN